MTDTSSPIILIGAARSGTKFLRDILAAPQSVKCVPYDVNYVWRHGSENLPHDALAADSLTDERIQYIRNTLFKLAQCREGEVLVEKTVSNSLRIAYVDRIFPNARYVHLVRDGRDVVESAMRQWRAKPDLRALIKKARGIPLGSSSYIYWFARNFVSGIFQGRAGGKVWGPRFPGIEELVDSAPLAEVCALQWRESVQQAQIGLAAIPGAETRVFDISYEDLIHDESALPKLLAGLGIPNQEEVLRSYQSKRKPSPPQRWKALSSDDQEIIGRVVGAVQFADSQL